MTVGVMLLDTEQRWYIGLIAGLIIGSLIPANAKAGSKTVITEDGTCGLGMANVALPITQPLKHIQAVGEVSAGTLQGIGVVCDPEMVEMHHRKGLSYAKMREYHLASGYHSFLKVSPPLMLTRSSASKNKSSAGVLNIAAATA